MAILPLKNVRSIAIKKDEYVRHADVRGIERIKLNKQYWGKPYIFICQGEDERYFIAFGKLGSLKDGNQFKLLKKRWDMKDCN